MPDGQSRSPAYSRALIAAMFAALVGAWAAALSVPDTLLNRLGREDAPIETAGAICFLVAAVGFFLLSRRAVRDTDSLRGPEPRRAVVYALLALLMFVCFGEEISWGQRVFGWETPGPIAGLNAQGETNLHNLQPVHQWHPDGTEKGFIAKLVNMNRLFSVFWLTVFVALPVLAAASPRVRVGLDRAGLPVPPLWTGGLFLTSYAIYKAVAFIHAGTIRAHALDELKETSYAAIYAFIAVAALISDRRSRRLPKTE